MALKWRSRFSKIPAFDSFNRGYVPIQSPFSRDPSSFCWLRFMNVKKLQNWIKDSSPHSTCSIIIEFAKCFCHFIELKSRLGSVKSLDPISAQLQDPLLWLNWNIFCQVPRYKELENLHLVYSAVPGQDISTQLNSTCVVVLVHCLTKSVTTRDMDRAISLNLISSRLTAAASSLTSLSRE